MFWAILLIVIGAPLAYLATVTYQGQNNFDVNFFVLASGIGMMAAGSLAILISITRPKYR